MMQLSAEALSIISSANQPNVAKPNRSTIDFERIFSDFFSSYISRNLFNNIPPFSDSLLLDIGPGQHVFGRAMNALGATVEAIDNDPAVCELGTYLNIHTYAANLKTFDLSIFLDKYDGVFCKFSINAFWQHEPESVYKRTNEFINILKPNGWGWIAPWNGIPKVLQEKPALVAKLELAQRTAFLDAGWNIIELSSSLAKHYGMGGNVTSNPIFIRNLDAKV